MNQSEKTKACPERSRMGQFGMWPSAHKPLSWKGLQQYAPICGSKNKANQSQLTASGWESETLDSASGLP